MVDTKPVCRGELERRLGAAFRAAREGKGVTLVDLARRLRCSVNTLRWHEAGARPMRCDDLVRAAVILNVAPATLIGDRKGLRDAATGRFA